MLTVEKVPASTSLSQAQHAYNEGLSRLQVPIQAPTLTPSPIDIDEKLRAALQALAAEGRFYPERTGLDLDTRPLGAWQVARDQRAAAWMESARDCDRLGHSAGLLFIHDDDLGELARSAIAQVHPGYEAHRASESALSSYIEGSVLTSRAAAGLSPDEHYALAAQAMRHRHCRCNGVVNAHDAHGNIRKLFEARHGERFFSASRARDQKYVTQWDSKCSKAKFCPDEAHLEGNRLANVYTPIFSEFKQEHPKHTVQFLVLTTKNIAADALKAELTRFHARINRQLKKFKTIKGALVVTEAPLSRDGKSWNLHANVMLMIEGVKGSRAPIDWQAFQEAWADWCHFTSWPEMRAATESKLSRRGMPASQIAKLSDDMVLGHAFRELSKYVTKLVGGESHSTFGIEKEALSMTRWLPEQFIEWTRAMSGYRRTRGYGICNDPAKYLWRKAIHSVRDGWLARAGLPLEFVDKQWIMKGKLAREECLTKEERDALRDVMFSRDRLDFDALTPVARLSFRDDGRAWVRVGAWGVPLAARLSLIQEDKSLCAAVENLPVSVRELTKIRAGPLRYEYLDTS